jgi:hypothetical protein
MLRLSAGIDAIVLPLPDCSCVAGRAARSPAAASDGANPKQRPDHFLRRTPAA